jgi:cytochrome P450
MLAHGEATRNMDPMEFMGNCVLLIVGGNDTTRNSISGGLWALNKHPDEYRKLRENPGLIPNMVPEIIRWQTPLSYMRRTALEDAELGGKTIRAGDKLAMWYISGNRDPEAIENPDRFIIDRARPRQHLSFGFGIHRCVGNRLAELQLTILWEEIMKRFPCIELMEEPKRVYSSLRARDFVHDGAHPGIKNSGGDRLERSSCASIIAPRPIAIRGRCRWRRSTSAIRTSTRTIPGLDFFARLRRDEPVHFINSPMYGPYWSVTRYRDIMQVDTSHTVYSSDALLGGIALKDVPLEFRKESFIAMDPPKHDAQRKIVSPIVAPPNLMKMSSTIRERACRILDELPRGEVFDWVDRVSVELTTQMLSTLFDFPFEERRTLTYWSNVATVNTRAGTEIDSEQKRDAILQQMLAYFNEVWKVRQQQPPAPDLISMLAHGEATKDLPSRPHEFMGNLLLLIVGGNDTTRNSISGGLLALNKFPANTRNCGQTQI